MNREAQAESSVIPNQRLIRLDMKGADFCHLCNQTICTRAHYCPALIRHDFYDDWESFWPSNVTWGELHGAANE